MLIVHFGPVVFMTIYTTENGIVGWIGMTIGTGIPLTPVLTGINRKILVVMVPGSRLPGGGIVALIAGNRKLCGEMGWIGSLVVVVLMAAGTGIRGVVIIAQMARPALRGNRSMCPGERIYPVMVKTCTGPGQGVGTVTVEA